MSIKETTIPHIHQHLARWKRALTVLTLALISACALISLLYISGVLSEVLEMSTLFAIFTTVFSILVPCCIVLTLITLSEPQKAPAEEEKPAEEQTKELSVDLTQGMLVYGEQHVRCRHQILLILQYVTSKDDHFISKADFARVLDDSTYQNDCESANAKINTLVSSIRATLKTFPYEIVNVNRQGYVLNKKEVQEEAKEQSV